MFIEREDLGHLTDWPNDKSNQPSNLYPNIAWEGVDVTEDDNVVDSCSSKDTTCTIDIKYDRDSPSIHFNYQKGATNPMTISCDNHTFDTWDGYKENHFVMYHPVDRKITEVNGRTYHGKVKIIIHHTVP